MNHSSGLSVDAAWVHEKPDWTDFYLVCGERIFKVEPFVLPEVTEIPPGARELPVVARDRALEAEIQYNLPTPRTLGEIAFAGTWLGDGVTLFLANGSAIISYLDYRYSDPTLPGNPCNRFMIFVEPDDFERLDIERNQEEYTPIEFRALTDE